MASKRHQRRRSCENKHRYDTSTEADQAARRLPGRWVYRCGFCAGWHVGRPPQWRRQSAADQKRNRDR